MGSDQMENNTYVNNSLHSPKKYLCIVTERTAHDPPIISTGLCMI